MEKLFSEFPPISTQEWEAVIAKDLKGADYDKKLVWRTPEGFSARPYYRADDLKAMGHLGTLPGEFPYVRGVKNNNDWLVRQTIIVESVADANVKALNVLNRGVQSLNFVVKGKNFTQDDLSQLLNGIVLEAVEVNFTGCGVKNVAHLLFDLLEGIDIAKDSVRVSFNIDPLINKFSKKGVSCPEFKSVVELVNKYKDYKKVKVVAVNGDFFNSCGATSVQEVAFSLAVAHDYLISLQESGVDIDLAAKAIKFNMAIGSSYFMEIAKFRASRMLWANIVSAYNPQSCCATKMRVHATTSKFNMCQYDPYVNMLRGTTEAMSGAIAGVSSMEVLPFDASFAVASEFSSRIARNTQLLLKEESHFDQVTDAAGGSYYVESLTESIANAAWLLFKNIEIAGGYAKAFEKGLVQDKIEESAKKRDVSVATRREVLLGCNQYPNFTEKGSKEVLSSGKDKKKCCCGSENSDIRTLKPYRLAESFEAIRKLVDSLDSRPKAFMLTLGNLAFCRARAQFSSNFFGCAGIEPIDNTHFETVEQGVAAAKESGAEIVVVCSSDDEYLEFVPKVVSALGDSAVVVVAGEPACKEELISQGVTNFISVRSNVLETLKLYVKQLGIL